MTLRLRSTDLVKKVVKLGCIRDFFSLLSGTISELSQPNIRYPYPQGERSEFFFHKPTFCTTRRKTNFVFFLYFVLVQWRPERENP